MRGWCEGLGQSESSCATNASRTRAGDSSPPLPPPSTSPSLPVSRAGEKVGAYAGAGAGAEVDVKEGTGAEVNAGAETGAITVSLGLGGARVSLSSVKRSSPGSFASIPLSGTRLPPVGEVSRFSSPSSVPRLSAIGKVPPVGSIGDVAETLALRR